MLPKIMKKASIPPTLFQTDIFSGENKYNQNSNLLLHSQQFRERLSAREEG